MKKSHVLALGEIVHHASARSRHSMRKRGENTNQRCDDLIHLHTRVSLARIEAF